MTTYWCPRATLPDGVRRRVRLRVEDGFIAEVAHGVEIGDGDVILEGLVRPGFANAHSHAFHRALRGHTHAEGGSFWTWRRQMYAVTARLDPASYQDLARAVFAEMVLAGYTVVGEFHYVHHGPHGSRYADPNAMSHALMAAAEESGSGSPCSTRPICREVCRLRGISTSTTPRCASPMTQSARGSTGSARCARRRWPGTGRPFTRCEPSLVSTCARLPSSRPVVLAMPTVVRRRCTSTSRSRSVRTSRASSSMA